MNLDLTFASSLVAAVIVFLLVILFKMNFIYHTMAYAWLKDIVFSKAADRAGA